MTPTAIEMKTFGFGDPNSTERVVIDYCHLEIPVYILQQAIEISFNPVPPNLRFISVSTSC
jgi:hypothetical protein